MDLSAIFRLCSFTTARQMGEKRRRRAAICRRRFRPEGLESRLMFDATGDFNTAIAAAQALYAGQATTEDAAFQSTEETDAMSFASQAQGLGEGLQTDVTADDQTLQTTADGAANTLQSQDAASDQLDENLNQSADTLQQQTIAQAKSDEASQDAGYESQLATQQAGDQADEGSTEAAVDNTYQSTMSADQLQYSSNVAVDQSGFDSTLTTDDDQAAQADATWQNNYTNDVAALASARDSQIAGATPAVDPSVADSDPGYQSALASANDAWTTAEQNATDDYNNGVAAADTSAAGLESAAQSQFSTDQQNIQNTYDSNVTDAQNQFAQAIVPFQTQLNNTLAGDQDTLSSAAQTAMDGYTSDMQTAGDTQSSSQATADATYNAAAQPLIDGYNTWLSGRTATYQGDINSREAQLTSDLASEDKTYNDTINGSPTVTGLLPTEQTAIASANSTYGGQMAGLAATQSSEDAGYWSSYNTTVSGADQTLSTAQDAYNDTVSQIYNDAMQNGTSPDQSALNAAWTTLLAADHAHANSVAGAAQTLTTGLGEDENEFATNQKPDYVQKEDAIAKAEGDYENGEAGAAKLRNDNDADHYASRDADEAEITAAYNDDVATHYESLQAALVPLQQARNDAYDDAEVQYEEDAATAWQTAQGKIEDAVKQQQEDDAAAYENYALQIAGPWANEQNQIAAAEQQRAHDLVGASTTFNNSMEAAVAADVSGNEAAFDQAMSDLESGVTDVNDLLAPAWAAAIIAASGNDADTTTWADAWENFDEQEAAADAQYMAQTVSDQGNDVNQGLAALAKLASQINGENQNLQDDWGAALVTLVTGDVGAAVSANGKFMPQLLSAADSEVDDARAEATKEINADVADDKSHASNDGQDAKAQDAHATTYAQTVLPAGLTAFTSVDDEAAGDVGTLEQDAASYVKAMDGAAVGETSDLVTDGEKMIHTEAGATCDYTIALTAQQVTDNNAAQAADVSAVSAAPDAQFAGESQGGDGYVTAYAMPADPDTFMPDKDLPALWGTISSFMSGVAEFVQNLFSPLLSPAPGGTPSAGGESLANAALNALCGPMFGSGIATLAAGGYLPDTYMIGLQADAGAGIEGQVSADFAIHFTGANPLDWEFGVVESHGIGVRMFGGVSGSFVVSAVQNCNSLNELNGVSGTADLGYTPAGLWSLSAAVGNIGTNGLGLASPICIADNIAGRRPTVYSLSTGPSFSPPNMVEPVSGGYVVTATTVETITPREFLTTMSSWENIQYAAQNYNPWDYWFGD